MKFPTQHKKSTWFMTGIAILLLAGIMPISAAGNGTIIGQGAAIYIGEEGLNVTRALNGAYFGASCGAEVPCDTLNSLPNLTSIGWWASAADIYNSAPSRTIDLSTRYRSLTVSPLDFVGYTGNWYLLDPNGRAYSSSMEGCSCTEAGCIASLVFSVTDPSLDIRIWDYSTDSDVTGKSVPVGERLGFRIDTNMYGAVDTEYRSSSLDTCSPANPDPAVDGFINIRIKNEANTPITALYNNDAVEADAGPNPVLRNFVDTQPFFWGAANGGFNWDTGALDTFGLYAYPVGTYTVSAESTLNNMKANYRQGSADYTGKTVSQAYTITLVANTLKIQTNKASLVRNKNFVVTITGIPSTTYHLWVQNTSDLAGGLQGQPPFVNAGQAGVTYVALQPDATTQRADAVATMGSALGYAYQNAGAGRIVFDDVSHVPDSGYGSRVAVNVNTTTSGTRTVEFVTTSFTKPQTYTIRVEQNFAGTYKRGEVNVRVDKGAVTIAAAGDKNYLLGEEVKFSGTNTESYKTYLFITGPDLNDHGVNLDDPVVSVINGDASTFAQTDVAPDNTWSYYWGTATVPLKTGTYTVYAVSQPVDRAADHIVGAAYGNVTFKIEASTSTAGRIGIYKDGSWYLDMNGDGLFNALDKNYGFGAPLWTPVAGDWNHDKKTEIGVYRDGAWYLDYDASGWWSAGDKNFGYGAPGWTPVVGDWNGDGSDKAGAFKDGAWYLDYDGSGTWNAGDKNFAFGEAGWIPVVGKWNDGKTKIGVYKDGVYYIDYTGDYAFGAGDKSISYGTTGSVALTGDWNANNLTEIGTQTGNSWKLDYDGLGAINASTKSSTFGAPGWGPVLGDWNDDGTDKIGIYLNGAWYLDQNGNGVWDAGTDKNFAFGTNGWIPVVGIWS